MSRIKDYPLETGFSAPSSDNFIMDSVANGTRRTRYRDLEEIVGEAYEEEPAE